MLVYLVFLGIFCVVGLFIYRLYFHPLHKFPGSKLASLSGLYEFYFDVVKDGSYIWEIEKMHDKYGPVIRINPNELHIKDSASYNEIYCGGRDKYRASTRAFGTPESTHETISYRHHQQRRKLLQGHFSKRAVMQLQPLIESKVDKLIHRLAKSKEDVEPVDLQAGFAALATDIISEHVCGTAYGCLHEADFQNDVRDQVLEWESSFQLVRLLPIFSFFKSYPFSLLHKLNPRPAKICLLEDKIRHHIMNAVELKGLPHSDVIAALTGTHVPAEEKTATRIQDECGFLLRAGTETTSRAFAVTMFYLLESPDIFQKLHSELKAAMPVATKYPRLTELESLPYLRAVIFEGIRLSVGLLTRLPRVATDEALQYNGWTIPKGVPVSQTAYFVHMDPDIFPSPNSFQPGRWLLAAQQRKHLESRIVAFTKGPRQCLGLHLALAEMYFTIAILTRRVTMFLNDTTSEDILPRCDRGVGVPKRYPHGLKVVVSDIAEE